jgi:hypothetical protein
MADYKCCRGPQGDIGDDGSLGITGLSGSTGLRGLSPDGVVGQVGVYGVVGSLGGLGCAGVDVVGYAGVNGPVGIGTMNGSVGGGGPGSTGPAGPTGPSPSFINIYGPTSLSGSNTYIVNSVFTESYTNYRMIFSNSNNGEQQVACQLNFHDDAVVTTSGYYRQRIEASLFSATPLNSNLKNQPSYILQNSIDGAFVLDILNPYTTTITCFQGKGTLYSPAANPQTPYLFIHSGCQNSNTSFKGIQLQNTTAVTFGGILQILGYN